MAVVGIVTEHLFLLLLWATRSAFLAQGLAMGTAFAAAATIGGDDAPAWLAIAARSSLLVGATLFGAGVLLVVARRLPEPVADANAPPSGWPALLAISLVVLPALAYDAASELPPLWREVSARLESIGFWDGLRQPGPHAGIVLLPLLAGLLVPGLVAAAAVS